MKKIGIVTQCFPPKIGGIEQLMAGLAEALAQEGWTVVVFADAHRNSPSCLASTEYELIRQGGWKPWRRWRKRALLKAYQAQHSLDFMVTDSWKSAEICLSARLKCPTISLAHGNEVFLPSNWRKRRISKCLNQVTAILANSHFTEELVQKLGVPSEKIHVVYPGISIPSSPIPAKIVRRVSLAFARLGHPILLTVGRLENRKGHRQVIASLPELQKKYPEIGYVIVGEGSEEEKAILKQQAADSSVTNSVLFWGLAERHEVMALYEGADLFVMPVLEDKPNRSVEGFGLVYIEAAHLGLVSVAGESGGAREAVLDGKTGVTCDGLCLTSVTNTIDFCLSDYKRLQKMSTAAQMRAKTEFPWSVAVHRYIHAFLTVGKNPSA